ncbi:Petal formation-expressed [Dillenia turbinata]|uniref:Petal formation-expressed n=1 Tax=Dillenia turbinata TaxID=194707 RepID=A0AAN8Z1Z8_9MAGN
MATSLQASSMLSSTTSRFSERYQRRAIKATLHAPKLRMTNFTFPKLDFDMGTQYPDGNFTISEKIERKASDFEAKTKLYAILEAVADRVEMHKNIGEQRSNWNSLLLTSINAITLSAATISAIASTCNFGAAIGALKASSTLLYLAATGMLIIMNKIQPSQLAEEQRNASRLFKQLQFQIETKIALSSPTIKDVNEAMNKVLALDKAYPLPLLGVMLEKFPRKVEPAVWWPRKTQNQEERAKSSFQNNGWSANLEEDMREIVEVLRRKDIAEYLRLGGKALKLNKFLAIAGPTLTGLAAVGSVFIGSPVHGPWTVVVGVVAGALASVVNTFEHGWQVGMVFEMYRSNAGFFTLMEETITSNLEEEDPERRENGEVFEMKVALQLGRSLSGLRNLASSSRSSGEKDEEEFASQLF